MAEVKMVRLRDVLRWAGPILGPDRSFFALAIVYGTGVGLLSLATPISVQMLINSINTGLATPLLVLSASLFVLLLLWALLSALRTYVMEIFRRRFMARLVAEITVRAVHAENPYFQDQRRADLFNRYFEVMTIHKAIPSLFVGGFTVALQAAVGIVLTSFYHPFFLVFNLLFVGLVWVIWEVWSRPAMRTAVELCGEKYEIAHWLETVGASDGFYKTARHLDYAMKRSEEQTKTYVKAHSRHFHKVFPQKLSLYVLYALASAGLLGLGGWLVINEQLSIGQLVAAELILAGVFLSSAQFGHYLQDFYDLVAGLNKLDQLYSLEQEARSQGVKAALPRSGTLTFNNVQFRTPAGVTRFDLTIPEGANLLAAGEPGTSRLIANLLKRHMKPDSGLTLLGGVDIMELDIFELRAEVIVIDRPTIVETTIADYLALANRTGDRAAVMKALRLVGLDDRIAMLPDGMQTLLSATGWPLSLPKTIQLKLAAAILSEPRILVLSPVCDMIPKDRLEAVFQHLADKRTTLLYFSNRPEEMRLDGFLWMGRDEQRIVKDRSAFNALRAGSGKGPALVVA
ncbi:MAG: ABC transporter ATP-binding protein [Sphingomonadaceae bacterium]